MIGLVLYLVGMLLALIFVSIVEKMHALAVKRNDKLTKRVYLAACVLCTALVVLLTVLSYGHVRGLVVSGQVVYMLVLFVLVLLFGDDMGVRPSKWFAVSVLAILGAIILMLLHLLGVPPVTVPFINMLIP